MIAYKYDEKTKEYMGTISCQLDPVETRKQGKEVWLHPLLSTFEEPPQAQEGKAIVFENNAWKKKNDYRGKRAYNDEGLLVIDYIGNLHGSDKLLTAKQIECIDNGTMIWKDGQIIPKPEPTIKEQIIALEESYSMTRWQREGILAEGSLYSDYVKAKAQQIEDLAEQIRS